VTSRPGLGLSALHLAALWTLAVALPQFSFLSGGEAVVMFGWEPLDIVAYALGLVLVPPALLAGLEALTAAVLGDRWRRRLHLLLVGVLAAVLAGVLLQKIDRQISAHWYPLTLIAGVVAAYAYARGAAARSFVTFLGLAPVVALVTFLAAPGVGPLVFPSESVSVESSAKARSTPVVLVVFDELPTSSLLDRRGRIDRSSYPAFAGLARAATWYPNATAVQDSTLAAVPGVLTGDPGDPGKPPSSRAYPATLFDVLAGSHRVRAFEQYRLCPASACGDDSAIPFPERVLDVLPYLRDAAFDSFLPTEIAATPPGANVRDRGDRRLGFDALTELRRLRGGNPFLFIHSYLPHSPWTYLPGGQTVAPSGSCCLEDLFPGRERSLGGIGGVRLGDDPAPVRLAQQEHLAQVRYADRLLGRLISELRATGLFERAMVVVTADHGVNFEPGESYRELTRENAESVLGIPMFVKYPHQERGAVDETHVQTLDVLPSVAATLGLDLPWEPAGLPFESRAADRELVTATSDVTGEEFEFAPRELDRERLRVAAETDRRFGSARGIQLYGLGPAPELAGSAMPGGGPGSGTATVDNPGAFADVDPGADSIPAAISGTVQGASAGDEIAIALNGRIAATTWVYDSADGNLRFEARIPPRALRAGRNEVTIGTIGVGGEITALTLE
jgi:hypothetical protein